jgi:hypothetical protein
MNNNIKICDWITSIPDISKNIAFQNLNEVFIDVHNVLEHIGDNAFSMPVIINEPGKLHFPNAGFFEAQDNTLKSILVCCRMGNLTDANVLLRKFRDNLFQWLFIITASDAVRDHNLNKLFSNEKNIIAQEPSIDRLSSLLLSWINNEEIEEGLKKKFLDIKPYISVLIENEPVKTGYANYLKDRMIILGTEMNDYTHGNGKKYIFTNNIKVAPNQNIEKLITDISSRVWEITACFMSFLILLRPHFLMSSDFSEYMDDGITPPEDSQYLISSISQEFIDKYITKIHPDLKKYLQEKNPYQMKID